MKSHSFFIFLFLILFRLNVSAIDNANNNTIGTKILSIIPQNSHVGIIVKSLNNDELVFAHNADQLFMPGSTLKILTAIAALKDLGPDFTYSTQLLGATNPKTCQQGDLYLKFSGDFSLTAKDLTELFSTLTQSGIHHITGNIIYDDPGYTVPSINPSWMITDIETCEMVPISKAIIDDNYYHFEIHPAAELSKLSVLKSKLGIEPRYKINNEVMTSSSEDYAWRSYGFEDDVLRIQGKAGIDLKPQRIELPVDDLDFYIQQNIAKALNENNIRLEGKIVPCRTPENAVVLAEHKSPTLHTMLTQALKYSPNVPFGALLLELASQKSSCIASWRTAANVLTDIFRDHYSIDLSQAVIDDGIGLSRYNLMTPKQLSKVLSAAYKDPSLSHSFINRLAQNGKPGYLQKRLTDPDLIGKIYAKTGSMSGISGIAGYLRTNQDNLLSFVIFVNNYPGPSLPYRDFQDKVCRILIEEL